MIVVVIVAVVINIISMCNAVFRPQCNGSCLPPGSVCVASVSFLPVVTVLAILIFTVYWLLTPTMRTIAFVIAVM